VYKIQQNSTKYKIEYKIVQSIQYTQNHLYEQEMYLNKSSKRCHCKGDGKLFYFIYN